MQIHFNQFDNAYMYGIFGTIMCPIKIKIILCHVPNMGSISERNCPDLYGALAYLSRRTLRHDEEDVNGLRPVGPGIRAPHDREAPARAVPSASVPNHQ